MVISKITKDQPVNAAPNVMNGTWRLLALGGKENKCCGHYCRGMNEKWRAWYSGGHEEIPGVVTELKGVLAWWRACVAMVLKPFL